MKILIMGTGGVGGYYGGLLAQQGNDVTFIAHGAHLNAIQRESLKVKSVHGDFTISPANATDDAANVGAVDLILFCVKTYNTDDAAQAIRPAVGPQTVVMSSAERNRRGRADRKGGRHGACSGRGDLAVVRGGDAWCHQADFPVPPNRLRRVEWWLVGTCSIHL